MTKYNKEDWNMYLMNIACLIKTKKILHQSLEGLKAPMTKSSYNSFRKIAGKYFVDDKHLQFQDKDGEIITLEIEFFINPFEKMSDEEITNWFQNNRRKKLG